ncbi:hypothetical protein HDK77DRAFT_120930 [Phyllosticta capitalensis]
MGTRTTTLVTTTKKKTARLAPLLPSLAAGLPFSSSADSITSRRPDIGRAQKQEEEQEQEQDGSSHVRPTLQQRMCSMVRLLDAANTGSARLLGVVRTTGSWDEWTDGRTDALFGGISCYSCARRAHTHICTLERLQAPGRVRRVVVLDLTSFERRVRAMCLPGRRCVGHLYCRIWVRETWTDGTGQVSREEAKCPHLV